MKFSEIARYDGDVEVGKMGWRTVVTTEEMLIEILQASANSRDDETVVTVSYAPSDTQEDIDAINARLKASGLCPCKEITPGRHHVSLWRQVDHPDDPDQFRNHNYASFIFSTEPDEMFWNGT